MNQSSMRIIESPHFGSGNRTPTSWAKVMGAAFRYTHLVKIDSTGKRKITEIAPAKAFFSEAFPAFVNKNEVPDPLVQRQLWRWVREKGDGKEAIEQGLLAQRCLLCYVSWQIEQVCQSLEAQFRGMHGFSASDLLPFVLNDDGSFPFSATYQPFSAQILDSFKPEQGGLSTWVNLRVKHHPDLNGFLLDCGLYLVSDWAILNDTSPSQLDRILREFHQRTPVEIEQGKQLLGSYHGVYRAERLRQRQNGTLGRTNSRCQAPTYEQLQQIALGAGELLSPEMVMVRLQELASQLRQYRIHVRGGVLPSESLDAIGAVGQSLAEQLPSPHTNSLGEPEDDKSEFLKLYRRQFLGSLEQALAQVTEAKAKKLARRDVQKAKQFLLALQLFHCQGKSMAEIAEIVGLQAQYQVTRLLKLKSFRADVRQQLLANLRDRVLELAREYSSAERLHALERQIEAVLEEQITQAIAEAQTESRTAKNRAIVSVFTQRLCRYLDRRMS